MKKFLFPIFLGLITVIAEATTIKTVTVKCGACGAMVSVTNIISSSSFGHMSLDTRPAPPASYNYQHYVQSCSKCGYVSYDITRTPNVHVKNYLKNNPVSANDIKLLSYRSLRAAEIQAIETPDSIFSAMFALYAAWDADDRNKNMEARYFRRIAIQYLQKFMKTGKAKADHWLLLADMQRRTGDFQAAKATVLNLLKQEHISALLRKIAEYELNLIEKKDRVAHDVGTAIKTGVL